METSADAGAPDLEESARVDVYRLHAMWKSGTRQVEFEPLRKAYNRATGKSLEGAPFLRLVHFLTTRPEAPALPTGVPGIHRHVIQLPGTSGMVHVLRRDQDDGLLADLRIPPSDQPADVRKLAKAMQDRALKNAVTRTAMLAVNARRREAEGSSAPVGNARRKRSSHQQLWLTRRPQLAPLYKQYVENSRGKRRFTGGDFVKLLQQGAGQPGASVPTGTEGIDRCNVRLPGIDRDIRFLMHCDADGHLTDLRLLPSAAEEPHLIDMMVSHQKRRAALSGRQAAGTREKRYTHLQRSQWTHLGQPLQAQYRAHLQRMHAQHESHAGIITFLRELNELCDKDGGTLVNAKHGITRHVLMLEGSDKPVTLLRRITADGRPPTLRHVGPGLMDEAMTINDIIGHLRASTSLTERRAPAEAGPSALPPAQPRVRVERRLHANQIARALEVMVANKAAGKQNLLEGADRTVGVDGPTIRSWFTHDGKLSRSIESMGRVSGFSDQRDAIYQHLCALGHEDQAACLPQPLSAELVAAVLQARVDHPRAINPASLARLTGGNRALIASTIDARDGTLRISEHRLQHLPGYDTQWQAIRTALQALGHTDKASRLPRPPTPGEQFLRALKEDMYPMAAAVNAMQADPGLSVREAASRMSDSLELAERLALLVAPGGQVRGRAEVEAQLPQLKLHLHQQELSALLAQLQPAMPSRMRRVLVPGFANFGAKLFIVNRADDNAGVQSTTKKGLSAIYADSPELVMPPRSFRHDRAKQALRWLSTVLKKEFKTTEVQCYFDAKRKEVWVSSNSDRVNRKIEALLGAGGLAGKLAEGVADAGASRESRHLSKLARKLAEPEAGGAMAPVLKAMAQARFRVPTETVYQHGKVIDLHAERRIKDAFQEATGEALNLRSLAGTMRPCTVCAEDLGLPRSAHRGPAWLSRSAQAFYDANAVVERNIGQAIGTYASLTRAGKLSVNYNTDSATSDDGSTSAASGKRKAGGVRIQEPHAQRARVEPGAAAAAAVPVNTMTELTRHLAPLNWPSSPPAATWRPASPQEPSSPTGAAAAQAGSPATRPRRS